MNALIKRRGIIKGQLTKLVSYAEALTDGHSYDEVKARLAKAIELLNLFIETEDKMFAISTEEESEQLDFDENYYRATSMLNEWLRHHNIHNVTPKDASLDMDTSVALGNSTSFKLPRVNIPTFTGDYREWQSFFDLYNAMVHENAALSAAQKFQYLKGLLKDEAASLVRHFAVTERNYLEALKKLCKRYDRKKHIVNSFIQTFMEQGVIRQPNAANIRKFTDSCDEVTRGLRALGTSAESRDPWLIYIMVNKLDEESRQLSLRESAENDFPTLSQLIEFLNVRADSLEGNLLSSRRSVPVKRLEAPKSFVAEITDSGCPVCQNTDHHLMVRADSLEGNHLSSRSSVPVKQLEAPKSFVAGTTDSVCPVCQNTDHHLIVECSKFKGMGVDARREFIKTSIRCFNCFGRNHSVYDCRSKKRCHECRSKHHTLVHKAPTINMPSTSTATNDYKKETTSTYTTSINESSLAAHNPDTKNHLSTNILNTEPCTQQSNISPRSDHLSDPQVKALQTLNVYSQTLLPTALVYVKDKYGCLQTCRALLDSGSQSSFVTESLMQKLQIPRQNARISVIGLSSAGAGTSRGRTFIEIHSRIDPSIKIIVNALILPKLTSNLPITNIARSEWIHLNGIEMADPLFHLSNPIDLLIGADQFFNIITEGRISGEKGMPIAQRTILGWIVAGQTHTQQNSNPHDQTTSLFAEVDIDRTLKRFWESEEIIAPKILTEEEQNCQHHFERNFMRSSDGRIVVKLPFKIPTPSIGNTRTSAIKRLHAMERKFRNDEHFRVSYVEFMTEYENLRHMELIPDSEVDVKFGYYLPHHGVLKQSSSTTKLRVVFDASCKSDLGTSLNDCLMVGPNIQSSLVSILLRFRCHKFVLSADIEKMYRQVLVEKSDTNYQRIVWRSTESQPVKHYRLLTVTYGTSSAAFLATRALHQVAVDNREQYPEVSKTILRDFYVDDLMTGAQTLEEARNIQVNISNVLSSAGFRLRKWASNDLRLLKTIPEEDQELKALEITEESKSVKLLGVEWNPKSDHFTFRTNFAENPKLTKRNLLSEMSQIFDPLGWLSPVIVSVKILFQRLWLHQLEWDDELPAEISSKWTTIRNEISQIRDIKIPRWLFTRGNAVELHGFADASESAYAAVVYCRVKTEDGIITTIVAAKTKVAPIKTISLPRLELCAAVLLTRLLKLIKESLEFEDTTIYAWTDSTIVLAWLSEHPSKWKTFIANRTSEILNTTSRTQWRHVTSQCNPADCASRGLNPRDIVQFHLWWYGPAWLKKSESAWPKQLTTTKDTQVINQEIRPKSVLVHVGTKTSSLLDRFTILYSSFYKCSKILASVIRCSKIFQRSRKNCLPAFTINLTPDELNQAAATLIRWLQRVSFPAEILKLSSELQLDKNNKLSSLTPFIHDDGLLRVGGRIENSMASFETKHPIILPPDHILTRLIIRDAHLKHHHAGPSLLMAILRQTYWIIGAKNMIRQIIFHCLPCFRRMKMSQKQLMGSLPQPRVTFERPFLKIGVDYAGPLQVCLRKGRGQRSQKIYVAVFVCLSTKAVHFELVSDLTTEAFVAAIKRFVSRRGLCSDVYSDNGTNFVGTKNLLSDLFYFLSKNSNAISNLLLEDKITWHLIPPAAPHFGGLWEAAVKSMKFHLRRVVGNTILTLEEMLTLIIQIEAVLNSRPICKPSSGEIDALTPAHFIIGQPLTLVPEYDLTDIKLTSSARWSMVQKMLQHFWLRWHNEYLTTLQQRSKWTTKMPNLKIEDIVVVRDDQMPPAKWMLGRITNVYPGKDGFVRVATVRTKSGEFKRPTHKLVLLPIN